MIKVALALQHGDTSRHICTSTNSTRVCDCRSPFGDRDARARLEARRRRPPGVSSFGFGGTNAHVVLEEAPAPPLAGAQPNAPRTSSRLSAQSDGALRELAHRFADHLTLHPEQPLADVCFTANVGRGPFAHRLGVDVRYARPTPPASWGRLRRAGDEPPRRCACAHPSPPADSVPFHRAGRAIPQDGERALQDAAELPRTLERCDRNPAPDARAAAALGALPRGDGSRQDETDLHAARAVRARIRARRVVALVGIEPDAVFGHSVGEYAAACFAGAFTLEEGLGLVADRARLMQSLPPSGEMAAVFAGVERVAAALEPRPSLHRRR